MAICNYAQARAQCDNMKENVYTFCYIWWRRISGALDHTNVHHGQCDYYQSLRLVTYPFFCFVFLTSLREILNWWVVGEREASG